MTPEDEEFERIAREIRRNAKEDDDIQEYKRPWVGLTDGEVEDYWDWEDFQTGAGRSTIFKMVRHIDATLKRKNNE
jgi:hypothetical protein